MAKVESVPALSIVILNFNGGPALAKCLSSVLSNTYENFELIVVDNASTDASPTIAQDFAFKDHRVKLIQNTTNLGFCEGYNVGASASRGKYIAMVHNDVEILPNAFAEVIDVMESDSNVGLCEGKILLQGNRVSYPGSRFNPILTGSKRDFYPEKDNGQYDYIHEIFSAGGVATVVRKSLAKEIGLYDPAIWIANDIEDLSWRVHLRGYKVLYVPRSIVYHSARLGAGWYKYDIKTSLAFHSTKNHVYVLLKNCSLRSLARNLPVIIVLRLGELIYLSLRNKPSLFLCKANAHLWLIKNSRYVWTQRSRVQRRIRRVPDRYVFRLMSKKPDFRLLIGQYKELVDMLTPMPDKG
jgi:GT2 family glycosyltransferase